jgi:hypothetical protein
MFKTNNLLVGPLPYDSRVSGRVEQLPVAISVLGLPDATSLPVSKYNASPTNVPTQALISVS